MLRQNVVVVFFTLTDRASTIPINTRGANPVRGLLDRKRSEEHLPSSNESKRKHKKYICWGRQHSVQPQCRPVHRAQPALTQRSMVQLQKVHPRTVRPTERSPLELKTRMLNDEILETMLYAAASRGARARAATIRCAEPTTAP